jgi:hypothetical protein
MDKISAILGAIGGAVFVAAIGYALHVHIVNGLNDAHKTDITNQIAYDLKQCKDNQLISEGIDNGLQTRFGAIDADLAGRVYDTPATACVSVSSSSGSGDATAADKKLQPAGGRSIRRADLDRIAHAADKEVAKMVACQSVLRAERALQKTP